MPIEGSLDGLQVGSDHTVDMIVYTTQAKTVIQEITGWAILLDIRASDTAGTSKLSVAGTVSGVFNSAPGTNTQKVSFSLPRALLATTIFKGEDPTMHYSVWRTDLGSKQPLRHGSVQLTRTTQSAA